MYSELSGAKKLLMNGMKNPFSAVQTSSGLPLASNGAKIAIKSKKITIAKPAIASLSDANFFNFSCQ